jgi:hypothetical protein
MPPFQTRGSKIGVVKGTLLADPKSKVISPFE